MSLVYVCLVSRCEAFHQPPRDLRGTAMYHAGGAGYACRSTESEHRPSGCTDGVFPESSWNWDCDESECVACCLDRVSKVRAMEEDPKNAECRAAWIEFLEHCVAHGAGMRPT